MRIPADRSSARLAVATLPLCLSAGVIACSEPVVFADWTLPVPEGARVVEYADATAEDRAGNHIDVVVIAGGRIVAYDAAQSRIWPATSTRCWPSTPKAR